ncbi:hypothetical protein B0H16DRAFT_1259740, partial [Mycena metata]
QDQLLAFIDGLNLAMTSSPPLRVVDLAGMVVGFIPDHWAIIAGTAIRTVAIIGARVLSKTLTERYLRAANLRLFNPKGLSARLCTTAAMQSLVMRTSSGVGPSTMTKIARAVGTLFLELPFDVGDGQKVPLAVQRRLASLEGYALPLQFDVPPPAKAQGVMDAMRSWALAFDQRRTIKKQNKVEKRRRELEELRQRKALGHEESHERREEKNAHKAAKRARKQEKKLERRVANADLIEHWQSEKGLWLVILNA